jgi:transcriptional regulator with XRE-family HTH domain
MSQAELARLVGLSTAAVWNWETKGRVPRARALAKVAEVLNVSELYLTKGTTSDNPPHSETPKVIRLVPEGAPPQYPGQEGATLAEVIEETRKRIAELTGFDPERVKVTLTML